MLRSSIALCAALAAACSVAAPVASTASACGTQPYSYAGYETASRVYGISARLTPLVAPQVESGHVAGWVGVGGAGQGEGGSDAWLQVGLNSVPGSGSKLYYEVVRPGERPEYVELDADVPVGESHRIAVLEIAGRAGWWRVWVDGAPRSEPIFLAGSHGRWRAIVTGESWNGGRPACNRYAYRFDGLRQSVRPGGVWRRLRTGYRWQDAGYNVRRDERTRATAGSTGSGASPALVAAAS